MRFASLIASPRPLPVALFGLMSDESDMFRDGTFKGLQISGVEESLSAFASEAKFRHEPQAYVPMTHMSLRRDQDLAKFIGRSLILYSIFLRFALPPLPPMFERSRIAPSSHLLFQSFFRSPLAAANQREYGVAMWELSQ